MHDFHERLPGYDERNILTDGCDECETRAANPLLGLTHLDHKNFRQAWADMLAAKWSGGEGLTRNVSRCDAQLMSALYTIAVLFERAAGQDPRVTLATIDAKSEGLEAKLA
ncbi:MAG TPA: hypothetical protein VK631_08700, partial [Solirubrobacteraceae bacterium]|nr:hypothetical protein [Solirubrobacteraceae bacterium]